MSYEPWSEQNKWIALHFRQLKYGEAHITVKLCVFLDNWSTYFS